MFAIHATTTLVNRPVCPECKAFMRLTRVESYASGLPKGYFAYACMDCHQTLELASDARERFAFHASAAAPG